MFIYLLYPLFNLFTAGVYISGPVWGLIVDRVGPGMPLFSASILLLVGYMGLKQLYDGGIGDDATVSSLNFTLLIVCNALTGLGGCAGIASATNATAKSFPSALVRALLFSLFVLT